MIYGSLQTKKGYYYVVAKVDGKQRWISTGIPEKGNNKRKAEEKKHEILIELEKKPRSESQKKTLYDLDSQITDWIDIFLENKKSEIRITSWESYKEHADVHVLPYFKSQKLTLGEIIPQYIRDYFNFKRKQGFSICTIKKHLVLVRGALQIAVENGILSYNPAYRLNLPRGDKFMSSFYSEEQANMLLSVIKDDPCEPAIILGLCYGLRRSECLGLRWRDIDFNNNVIQIRNTVVKHKTLVEKEQTKSKSSARILYIIPETRDYLLKLKQQQAENRLLLGSGYKDSDHICVWADGRQFTPQYVSEHFSLLLRRNGLPHIRFHELRHSCGSLLLNRGISVKQIQEYLGHEQVSTTLDLYGHLSIESKKESAQVIGNVLNIRIA